MEFNNPAANRTGHLLNRCRAFLERLPLITLFVATVATLLHLFSGLGDRLCYDRTAIEAGESWRLLGGHLTHWNTDHLVWDVFMFAVLGAIIERHTRAGLLAILFASATFISLAIWLEHADIEHYRGLSGIDSALFTFCLSTSIHDARREKQPLAMWALFALATGFVGKILWELATGSTLFVDSSAAGFTPLPLVHAVGGCAGILTWLMRPISHALRSRGQLSPASSFSEL